MERYFLQTRIGQLRSGLIIPEPFFVHSDLTTMIQMTDLIAYVVSWGVRLTSGTRPMMEPKRGELDGFAQQVCRLRYRNQGPDGREMWGLTVIGDLKAADSDSPETEKAM